MQNYISFNDSRISANQNLPKFLFDYIDGGSHDEATKNLNLDFFDKIKLLPRNGVLSETPQDLSINYLGDRFDFPFYLSPIGSTRLFWPNAEMLAALCADQFNIPYCLSSFSGTSLHSLRESCKDLNLWFQLYQLGDRDLTLRMLNNAQAAKVTVLVVTIDTPVPGYRIRDLKNNLRQISSMSPMSLFNPSTEIMRKLPWYLNHFRDGGFQSFPNIITDAGPLRYSDAMSLLTKTRFQWSDLKFIRETWKGKIVVKGIQSAFDAKNAIDHGCDSFIVSNHGGRQLESLNSTISILRDVKSYIPDGFPMAIDGGIQNSLHIVKALGLGASMVGLGRSYIWPLASSGQKGLISYLSHLTTDLSCTMDLLGCSSLLELGSSFLDDTNAR